MTWLQGARRQAEQNCASIPKGPPFSVWRIAQTLRQSGQIFAREWMGKPRDQSTSGRSITIGEAASDDNADFHQRNSWGLEWPSARRHRCPLHIHSHRR